VCGSLTLVAARRHWPFDPATESLCVAKNSDRSSSADSLQVSSGAAEVLAIAGDPRGMRHDRKPTVLTQKLHPLPRVPMSAAGIVSDLLMCRDHLRRFR
jgi:hypothetical protein